VGEGYREQPQPDIAGSHHLGLTVTVLLVSHFGNAVATIAALASHPLHTHIRSNLYL
jgi:hypothetical protein